MLLPPPIPPDPPELAQLRAEIKKHRSPLYAGLFPLLDAFERFAVASVREMRSLEKRIRDLEAEAAEQGCALRALAPPGDFVPADSPLGRQALDELERRKHP